MNNCRRCNVNIIDDAMICPLCNGVLERQIDHDNEEIDFESHSIMYPDVTLVTRRMKFIIRLAVFTSVLIEAILIIINYLTFNGVRWSIVCGAALAYICFTLIYTFQHNKGYKKKIMHQAVGVMAVCVVIDWALGYSGWSLAFAIPITVLAIDLAIFVMMMVNSAAFQVYIMMQVYTLVISVVAFLLVFFTGLASFKVLAAVALGVSLVLFLGTVVFGDKSATSELSRRFRV